MSPSKEDQVMASSSPFLDLPAELRNNVYEYAALADQPFCLKPRLKVQQARHLTSTSPLILASHEVAEEYYSVLATILMTTNATILARVTDFKFRHLIRFITNQMLTTPDMRVAKRLIVELILTSPNQIEPEKYSDWLAYCKKWDFSAEYTVNNSASGFPFDEHVIRGLNGRDCEAAKISAALEDWCQYRNNGGSVIREERMFTELLFMPRS
ncbi:hypothetical protein LTR91_010638 [Friedmanniomyces endolithicus]|uniref:F-box domain-containing protein n=1 Tax=Friedmanniomyces endolithicus TaxID=329885 RepID=A0A4U0USE9_9PEZI|nr:hypothetical protein LTS09_015240 [Friedmanniomyces endolithicus]KAK0286472.1 hypothetical protein LTS00_010410 [Friedmanniomyces endolithicus]KAK0306019.1 hypothetical protein LTR01_006367 [Friedmanniomyces endolithicus]KAK0828268.1 hypothetical protein LTR73_005221 [Friedmanniomyces endolithicus]KAK0985216.1 hypothetical protein LTR91_010638 [Friedmanniomyces endolithicus]